MFLFDQVNYIVCKLFRCIVNEYYDICINVRLSYFCNEGRESKFWVIFEKYMF